MKICDSGWWSVLVLVLAILLPGGCSVEVASSLTDKEAGMVLAALEEQGISGRKMPANRAAKGGGIAVQVGRVDAQAARRVLRDQGLPRPRQAGISEALGKPGLLPSAGQRRALLSHAQAGELAATLQRIDGVLEARVHLVLPLRVPLLSALNKPDPASASVLLRLRAAKGRPPPISQDQVQRLVAGGVAGLEPSKVTVVQVQAEAGAGAPGNSPIVMTRVGPFQLARSSRSALLATLCIGLLIIAGLGLLVIMLLRRKNTSPPEQASPEISPELESSISLLSKSFGRRKEG